MISEVQKRGAVSFPAFTGERRYMIPFNMSEKLPSHLERWQLTVDQMLAGIEADGEAYLMIDQAKLDAGQAHRRPGLHVDNHWIQRISAHGGGGGWNIPPHHTPPGGGKHRLTGNQSILLASSHLGCVAYDGAWVGSDNPGGDCKNINVGGMSMVPMTAGTCWAGDAGSMLHESIPMAEACLRTVVRINIPLAIR